MKNILIVFISLVIAILAFVLTGDYLSESVLMSQRMNFDAGEFESSSIFAFASSVIVAVIIFFISLICIRVAIEKLDN